MQQSWIKDGKSISGNYLGNPFTGVVVSSRVKYGGKVQYTVNLDSPIQLRWRTEPTNTILVDCNEVQG